MRRRGGAAAPGGGQRPMGHRAVGYRADVQTQAGCGARPQRSDVGFDSGVLVARRGDCCADLCGREPGCCPQKVITRRQTKGSESAPDVGPSACPAS